jgi:hypothetical protein
LGNAQFATNPDNVTHPLCACSMTHRSGHETFFGPSTIAIHDDGYVLRQYWKWNVRQRVTY